MKKEKLNANDKTDDIDYIEEKAIREKKLAQEKKEEVLDAVIAEDGFLLSNQ